MALDKATVAKVATLARIKVPDSELEKMAAELRTILAWVEQLDAVDTAGVEPMASVVETLLPQRADAVDDGGDAARVTANAAERVGAGEGAFFVVPKVIE